MSCISNNSIKHQKFVYRNLNDQTVLTIEISKLIPAMKEEIKKEYPRRTRKPLETKLCGRDLIKRISTWAVSLVRYSGPFLKWTRQELKQMDQRTRKLMTIQQTLHLRHDVNRLYGSRKEGGKGLATVEDNVDASI